MIKRVMTLVVVFGLFIATIYLWQVWTNNRDTAPPGNQEVRDAFEAAVGWFQTNQSSVLRKDNPFLWLMVQRSAALTGDERLQKLFNLYHERYKKDKKHDYWRLLFVKGGWEPVRYEQIQTLDDYQQYFVYAITCDQELGSMPLILAQNEPSYCDAYPFRPSCVTHQMMGLRLAQERQCDDDARYSDTLSLLQRRVKKQLTWDPRMLDHYIQRVLMLYETGAGDLVKPVWVLNVIDGSLDDGGWPAKRRIIDLPGSYDLILTRNFIGIGNARSTFHATAQGLLILAHLLSMQH